MSDFQAVSIFTASLKIQFQTAALHDFKFVMLLFNGDPLAFEILDVQRRRTEFPLAKLHKDIKNRQMRSLLWSVASLPVQFLTGCEPCH